MPTDTDWRPRWFTGPDPERKERFYEVHDHRGTFIHLWRYAFWPRRSWAWNVHHLMPGMDFMGRQHYSTTTGQAKSKRAALRAAREAVLIAERARRGQDA